MRCSSASSKLASRSSIFFSKVERWASRAWAVFSPLLVWGWGLVGLFVYLFVCGCLVGENEWMDGDGEEEDRGDR